MISLQSAFQLRRYGARQAGQSEARQREMLKYLSQRWPRRAGSINSWVGGWVGGWLLGGLLGGCYYDLIVVSNMKNPMKEEPI